MGNVRVLVGVHNEEVIEDLLVELEVEVVVEMLELVDVVLELEVDAIELLATIELEELELLEVKLLELIKLVELLELLILLELLVHILFEVVELLGETLTAVTTLIPQANEIPDDGKGPGRVIVVVGVHILTTLTSHLGITPDGKSYGSVRVVVGVHDVTALDPTVHIMLCVVINVGVAGI